MKNIFACGLASASFLLCHALSIPATSTSDIVAEAEPLQRRNNGQNNGLLNPKYFYEAGIGAVFGHYDIRFYTGNPVSPEVQAESLHHLIVSYNDYMSSIGISTWLAHGTLLGWFWNGQVLPWDTDLDVQVWAEDLYDLAKYNQTAYEYNTVIRPTTKRSVLVQDDAWRTPKPREPLPFKRKYLLDVNPHHVTRSSADWQNVIDARWIDTETGLFIDITGLAEVNAKYWTCKNNHFYEKDQVNKDAMVQTYFEGSPAMVPSAYVPVLVREYGPQSLQNEKYNRFTFWKETAEWIADGEVTIGLPEHTESE